VQTSLSSLVTAAETGNLSPDMLRSALEEADWPYFEAEIPIALQQSREGMARVTSIVQAMKEFSHPGKKEFEQVDINNLIELTATVARNEWKCCAELILDLNPDLPVVAALSNEIGQVLLNLLVNAAHTITEKLSRNPDGDPCRITIKTGVIDSSVIISIADTGCGIPEQIRTKVFDPFFTTKTVGQGTGQGLAIAYDVVTRKHKGSLDFETVLGEGTTFTIKLPINKPTAA
jgi:signal transduction histidine kinase